MADDYSYTTSTCSLQCVYRIGSHTHMTACKQNHMLTAAGLQDYKAAITQHSPDSI